MSNKQDWHVVSFSGGKDSTAMLLMMLERGMQVDDIVFCDTGLEFPQMYEHLRKVEDMIGRKITRLKPEHDWNYYMFEHKKTRGKNKDKLGYGFPTFRFRWCTGHFKMQPMKKYFKEHSDKNIIQYIGFAYDEQKRMKDHVYPLIEWKITEADALAYCKEKGFDWGGLYDFFDRLSCWCCPLSNMKEVKTLYFHFPHLWKQLKDWENKTTRTFKVGYTMDELEDKFKCEKKGLKYKRSCKK